MSTDIEKQEKTVLWGYCLQWSMLLFPISFFVSLIYLLVMRSSVTQSGLRSHLSWQLSTLLQIAIGVAMGFALLFIGMSGWGTDAPLSVGSTFLLLAATTLFLPWLLYRLIRGSLRFHKQEPMLSLFP
jgi:uncharacterized membrane protein